MSYRKEKLLQARNGDLLNQVKVGEGLVRDEEGNLYVKISSYPDNLLRLIPSGPNEGLYCNYTPPVIKNDYYVDAVAGSDENEGTRSKPLKTIKEAFLRIPNISDTYTIYLKENQRFTIERQSFSDDKAYDKDKIALDIRVYGDNLNKEYPNVLPNGFWYFGYKTKSYPRPTIKTPLKYRADKKRNQMGYIVVNKLRLIGVNITHQIDSSLIPEDKLNAQYDIGWMKAITKLEMHGCIIKVEGKPIKNSGFYAARLWESITVKLDGCILDINPTKNTDWVNYKKWMLFSGENSSKITIHLNGPIGRGAGFIPDKEPLIPSDRPISKWIYDSIPEFKNKTGLENHVIADRELLFNNFYKYLK